MSIQDPSKRPYHVRASHLVKRLKGIGGLQFPNGTANSTRRRSISMDAPRKRFTSPSQPALISHSLHDNSSERSSGESMPTEYVHEHGHRRVFSMPSWDNPIVNKPSTPPSIKPPGIIVTQHHSDSPYFILEHSNRKGNASFDAEAPEVISTLKPAALSDPGLLSGHGGHPGPKAVPPSSQWKVALGTKPLPSLPSLPPNINSSIHKFTSDLEPDTAYDRGARVNDKHTRIISPVPDRTPLLRPWTPRAVSPNFHLHTVPSGDISPMVLGSPAPTPSPPSTSPSSLPDFAGPLRRPFTPRLPDLPRPSFSPTQSNSTRGLMDKEGHSLRLSPAVIQRFPPWPVKSLPSIPIDIGPGSEGRLTGTSRIATHRDTSNIMDTATPFIVRPPNGSRLSSMPALPMSGSMRSQVLEVDELTHHRTRTAVPRKPPEAELVLSMDEDEEVVGRGQDHLNLERPSRSMDPLGPSTSSIIDMGNAPIARFGGVDRISSSNIETNDTDTDTRSFVTARTSSPQAGSTEYFSLEPRTSTDTTPRPSNFGLDTPRFRARLGETYEENKGIHTAHSMFDLHSRSGQTDRTLEDLSRSKRRSEQGRKRKSVARRHSLSSINAAPPSYRHHEVEEEGERLPEYSNSILLIAQMPRKMEFTRPGVLSRDRKWRRVWCVLEGTKFSLYRIKGVKSVWEGVVGAGDGAANRTNNGKEKGKENAEQVEEQGREWRVKEETRAAKGEQASGSSLRRSPSPTTSSFLVPQRLSTSLQPNSSIRHKRSSSSVASSSRSGPDPSLLIQEYTLQHAESGLAADYKKRQNVIRVRMGGEQFLLQCKDTEDVVEWIEGFQAASDIALDLDERKMPRGALFPRRRRRRRPRPSEDEGNAETVVAPTGTNAE